MPKTFSEQERAYIQDRLKAEGKRLFSQYGVKKTTVDELVRRVKIPKGTFYLFYESKELLLFEIILEEQAAIQGELIRAAANLGGQMTKAHFSSLIYELLKRATESFLFPLFTSGEYELIFRKLPPEALARNINDDNASIQKLFSLIPQAKGKDMGVYSGAFRAIALLSLHREEIGPEQFDDAVKLLIDGLTEKLFEVQL